MKLIIVTYVIFVFCLCSVFEIVYVCIVSVVEFECDVDLDLS
jgi:hypothetical protein